jgi:hypothetical protein
MIEKDTTAPSSGKEWLKTGKLAETHLPVCIRGDLFGEIQELDRQLHALKEAPVTTLADRAAPRRLAEQIEALRQQMLEATKVFKLRAVGDREWDRMTAAHPPRPGNEEDAKHEVNIDTFYIELLQASVYEPAFDAEDWGNLRILLTKGQRIELQNAAVALNKSEVSVPFSSAASRILRASESDSQRPAN